MSGRENSHEPLSSNIFQYAAAYAAFAPKDHRASEETLDLLVQALIRQHPLDVQYDNSAGQQSSLRIEPWSLVMYRDGFYVLARGESDDHPEPWLFALERMSEAKIDRSMTFEVPDDFDPAKEFGHNLGLWRTEAEIEAVEIAFDSSLAAAVRSRQWPGLSKVIEAEDGRIVLSLDVPITPEIVSWILM